MYCPKCKSKVKKNMNFCKHCGTPIVQKKAKKSSLSPLVFILGLLVGALLCGVIAFLFFKNYQENFYLGNDSTFNLHEAQDESDSDENEVPFELQTVGKTTFEGEGYSTPEDAVMAYLDAMKSGDVYGMIETFAIETFVEHYNLAANIERINSYTTVYDQTLVPDNEYTEGIGVFLRIEKLTTNLDTQYLYLNGCFDVYDFTRTVTPLGQENIPAFLDLITEENWMNQLADMEIGSVWVNEETAIFNEDLDGTNSNFQNNLAAQMKIIGCDDFAWTITNFVYNGEEYWLFMDVACYDGVWYNYRTNGFTAAYCGCPNYTGGILATNDF